MVGGFYYFGFLRIFGMEFLFFSEIFSRLRRANSTFFKGKMPLVGRENAIFFALAAGKQCIFVKVKCL